VLRNVGDVSWVCHLKGVEMNASRLVAQSLRAALAVAACSTLAGAMADDPNRTALAAFAAENDAAMTKMMSGMGIKSSGDIDQDFATMMIAHHQGAIDMALAQLRYGKNEQLRRIAQEIVIEQEQEIAAMNLALGRPLPVSDAAPTQGTKLVAVAATTYCPFYWLDTE
jgi:uncharacterized protein (DUF305 family)